MYSLQNIELRGVIPFVALLIPSTDRSFCSLRFTQMKEQPLTEQISSALNEYHQCCFTRKNKKWIPNVPILLIFEIPLLCDKRQTTWQTKSWFQQVVCKCRQVSLVPKSTALGGRGGSHERPLAAQWCLLMSQRLYLCSRNKDEHFDSVGERFRLFVNCFNSLVGFRNNEMCWDIPPSKKFNALREFPTEDFRLRLGSLFPAASDPCFSATIWEIWWNRCRLQRD